MSNSNDFSGKVVIITGSTSGIGEGIAIYLSKLGANVVITGRSEQNVKRVADICQSVSPKNLKALEIIADITIEEDVKRLVDTSITVFVQIDVLVNNAGALWPTSIDDSNHMETCSFVKSNIGVDFGLDKVLEQTGKATPLGIYGSPQHIANVVAFLASSDAMFITGATLIADSGATLTNADLK